MLNKNTLKTLMVVVPLLTLAACKSGPTEEEIQAEKNRAAEAAAAEAKAAEERAAEEARKVELAKAEGLRKAQQMMEDEKEKLSNQNVVYFDFDGANVKSDFHSVLDMHAAFLVKNPGQSIVIEGHCDNRGTPEYNIALGERRAKSVQTYLQNAGVSSSQISVVSYGEEKPAVQGASEYAFAQNRRGVVVYQ